MKIGFKLTVILIILSLVSIGAVGITILLRARTSISGLSEDYALSVARESAVSTVQVKQGSGDMAESGRNLASKTNEFITISTDAVSGMNEIVGVAVNQIKLAITQVDEMSVENNRNFEDLKTETAKFKVDSGNEKKKVLVVDDDRTQLTMVKGMLEGNYEVTAVSSGEEALRLFFQGLVPNVVLLDLVMPEMGGWDTYKRIRGLSNLHNTPIAIFTASNNSADRNHAKEMGVVDYIEKPCGKTELLKRIERIIG